MGNDHHENIEHDESTEKTGVSVHETVTHSETTASETDGSYVDSEIPEDGADRKGSRSDEADGEFTDSDIPADR
jgi:hypothetical protein